MRAPLGGLFRHVCDLATAQAEAGHSVGIVCDATPGNEQIERKLRSLADLTCALGVTRIPMSRWPSLKDLNVAKQVRRLAQEHDCNILHGHGAKGGAYARLAAARLKKRGQKTLAIYTAHGGSLHYDPASFQGAIYSRLERRLGQMTDGIIFESAYSAGVYERNIGPFPCEVQIIHNGLQPDEFYSPVLDTDARDFVFVGELRALKGVDVLLKALARVRKTHDTSLFLAGGGPDESSFRKLSRKLGLEQSVYFAGPTPARSAFARGQCLIVPSRAESLPYIVLEAAAASLPVIATDVGGISEIFQDSGIPLIPPDDIDALAQRMIEFLENRQDANVRALQLQELIRNRFVAQKMAQSITHFYVSRLLAHTAV